MFSFLLLQKAVLVDLVNHISYQFFVNLDDPTRSIYLSISWLVGSILPYWQQQRDCAFNIVSSHGWLVGYIDHSDHSHRTDPRPMSISGLIWCSSSYIHTESSGWCSTAFRLESPSSSFHTEDRSVIETYRRKNTENKCKQNNNKNKKIEKLLTLPSRRFQVHRTIYISYWAHSAHR